MAPSFRNPRRSRLGAPRGGLSLLALTLGLAVPPGGELLAQGYNFRHYTNQDGLPQSQVLALHQDHEGYVWFGTFGGIGRYNGTTIVTYTTVEGLSSNVVEAVAEDDRGRLYLATLGGGMCRMEGGAFQCFSEQDGLPSPDVRDVAVAGDESVWLATDAGVVRFRDGSFTTYTQDDGLPSSMTVTLAVDAEGVLWVGTRAGLARYGNGGFQAVLPEALGSHVVRTLLPLPSGLLVGTDSALHLLSGNDLRLLEPGGLRPGAGFNDAALDPSGRVWIATDGGLLRMDGEEFLLLTEANNLPAEAVRNVMADREGTIWAGTDAGAAKLIPGPFRGYSTREGLPNAFARALAEDGSGRLWAGTRHGAAAWEPAEGRFQVTLPGDALPDGRVFALAAAPEGGMLVGTREGLAHWNQGSFRLFLRADGLPADYVLSLLPDGAGNVWVGTQAGIARWSQGRVVPFPAGHPLAGLFAVSLAQDLEGRLWIGLPAGGVRIWDGETLESLDAARGLTDQVIWSMARDGTGRMWVGSNGDGAFRVDGPEIVRFHRGNGLVNDFVWQILVDSRESVWLYTSQGMDRYRDGAFEHFGQAAGLIDLEGTASAAIEDAAGQLWFGTSRGVLAYDPAEERVNLVPPPIRLEEVTLDGVRLDPAGELRFRSGLLQIGVAALSFRDERAVRYRYRLSQGSPEEQPWSEPLPDRTVSFASLGPGRYTLQVLAINADGVESQLPASLSFTVLPAFWQSWWFRTLGLGILALAAAAIPVLRARQLERERRRLEVLVTRSTGELARTNQRLREEIQERERFEVALQDSEARLRDIVENSASVFYSHTPDHEITYVSPQIQEVLGMPPDEVAMRWTELATDHPMNEEGQRITEEAIRTGRRQPSYELELRHADGRAVQVRVMEAPLLRDGEVVAMVGSLTDVTEARRMQKERKHLEEQLRQAQKLEAVGVLAGGVAHDFNNLLTSIVGHTSLMAMELEPDHALHSDLAEVERACDRAASLVAQLLAFGRRQMARPTNLDLNDTVQAALEKLDHLLEPGIRLDTELSAARPRVVMDPGQLERVLLNLALNAGEAMPSGGTVTVSTGVEDLVSPPEGWAEPDFAPGTYAVLAVQDTGPGMDPETSERIFEPFFTTKELGKGSGLGLSTVHGIVRQNRGHIQVETAPRQGTTFRIFLPVAPAAVRGHLSGSGTTPGASGHPSSDGGPPSSG